MPDKFDAYREALVVETNTVWPVGLEGVPAAERQQIETAVHAAPECCAQLEYIRMHTGFCRQITVTPEDLQRVRAAEGRTP
jgi:hypothetical protein